MKEVIIMLNKNELKQKLVTTSHFVDNEYLDRYLNLVYDHEIDSAHYSENHHVIPVALYKLNNEGCDRRKAEKFAKADPDNFEVLLLYRDHCLAHYLLYFCTTGKLKSNMQCIVRRLIAMVDTLSSRPTIAEKLPSEEELAKMQRWRDCIQQDKDSQYWTKKEVTFLTENYPIKGSAYCANTLNRSRQSVRAKAFLLNLPCYYTKTNGRPWTEEELNILKIYYTKPNGVSRCCELIDRPKQSIISKANRLGIKSAKKFTTEEITFLKQNYAIYGPILCAEKLERSYNTIRSWGATNNVKYRIKKED
jgi:hypothetical protein